MRLDFLLLADKAEAINGKLYMMGGGFDRVSVGQLPGTASYDVAVGFIVDYHETNHPHEFTVRLEDEDNQVVDGPGGRPVEVSGRFEVGRPPGLLVGQEQRVIIVVRGPFPAPRAGLYNWVPAIDGEEYGRTRFSLEATPPPVGPTPINPMPD